VERPLSEKIADATNAPIAPTIETIVIITKGCRNDTP
jgi:hypothetical protein